MLIRHAIGAVLRRLRLAHGLTLRQLSAKSRVSMPYLSEIERGRKEASSEILATVCAVLDVSLEDFLTEVGAQFADARPRVLDLRSVGGSAGNRPVVEPARATESVRTTQEYLLAA